MKSSILYCLRLSKFFYRFIGVGLIHFVFAMLVSTVLESIGLVMLLPLLNSENGVRLADYPALYNPLKWLGVPPIALSFGTFLLILGGIFFLKALTQLYLLVVRNNIIGLLWTRLRVTLIHAIRQVAYVRYTEMNMGDINNVLLVEVDRIAAGFRAYSLIIAKLLEVVFYLSVSVLIDWRLVVIAAGLALVTTPVFRFSNRLAEKLSAQATTTSSRLQHFALQFLGHLKYFKATGDWKILDSLRQSVKSYSLVLARRDTLNTGLGTMIEPIGVFLVLGYLFFSVSILGQKLSVILVASLMLYRTSNRLFMLPKTLNQLLSSDGSFQAYERLLAMLSEKEHIGANQNSPIPEFRHEIRLSGVSFAYGQRNILGGIELVIPKNKTIGIVGNSGEGKTTLFDIIVGLLEPTRGAVTLDGVDYREFDRGSLSSLFGYVTQDSAVFNDTIMNNISMWDTRDPSLIKAGVIRASRLADCDLFIRDFPDQYEASLGERGVRLSGGQRQRIAIARELYRDSPILILDEATSALDSQAESTIQASVRALGGLKTILVISHRLSTVRTCDYIYVLKGGQICESGAWDDLVGQPGSELSEMCRIQGVQ